MDALHELHRLAAARPAPKIFLSRTLALPEGHKATVTVEQRRTEYDSPEPRLVVTLPMGVNSGSPTSPLNYRHIAAPMHRLMAEVERASISQRWVVKGEESAAGDGGFIISLELMDGTPKEAEAGIAVLKRIAGRIPPDTQLLSI